MALGRPRGVQEEFKGVSETFQWVSVPFQGFPLGFKGVSGYTSLVSHENLKPVKTLWGFDSCSLQSMETFCQREGSPLQCTGCFVCCPLSSYVSDRSVY